MDQEARIRDMLVALGPGGTRELAERALSYRGAGQTYEWMGGLAEVAALVDRSPQAVRGWITTKSAACPEPVRKLTATPVWDLRQWHEWGQAHPDLMGPEFDPFRSMTPAQPTLT